MKCPKCKHEQPDENLECPHCGIIFEKYFARQQVLSDQEDLQPSAPLSSEREEERILSVGCLKRLLLHVPSSVNPFYFGGRVIAFLLIFIWGWKFILAPMESNYVGQSFMHLINLPFHEAGHIFFRPFGQFVMMLGGSLGQLLMPFICLVVFVMKTKDTFGASIALWWLGESFMDLAPYINDARELKLMLIGGVTGREVIDYHDWEFILRKLGWLRYDHTLAHMANTLGIVLMLASFAWGGYVLFRQYKNLDR
jgi:hypothetical protein